MKIARTLLFWVAVYAVSFALDSAHVYEHVSNDSWTFLAGMWVGIMWAALSVVGWGINMVKDDAERRGDPRPSVWRVLFPKEDKT